MDESLPEMVTSLGRAVTNRKLLIRPLLLLLLCAFLASCGGGVSPSAPPPAAPRPPRQLTGLEPFAPRTEIRVGQRVGPLIAYGTYDDGTTGTVVVEWTSSDPAVVAIGEDDFAEGVGAGMAVLTGTFEDFSVELEFTVEDPNPRSTRDRPDDIGGPQVHFVYAVPSDREELERDRFGEIERSVTAMQNWLQDRTRQRLRVDTYQGGVDVSFLRLSFTHQEGDGFGASLMEHLMQESSRLAVRGDKVLGFYYEGRAIGVCGSAWFQRGGAHYVDCVSSPRVGVDEATFGAAEATMLHELFHVFGAVPLCAPNEGRGYHVIDEPADLMYAGEGRVELLPEEREYQVDVGRNDYYGHGRSDCIDISRSRFLELAPGSAAPVEVRLAAGEWPLRCEVEH